MRDRFFDYTQIVNKTKKLLPNFVSLVLHTTEDNGEILHRCVFSREKHTSYLKFFEMPFTNKSTDLEVINKN